MVAQREKFPSHFQHKEKGLQEVSMEQSPKMNEEEVEELPLQGNSERTIRISKNLSEEFKEKLSRLFHECEDLFAWDHTELKGVDPQVC